jgi:NAD-dependent deacetylase
MKKIVVLSGAGMSAESGISTFRDAGGLWEGHDIMEVASTEGWRKNPELVTEFYNKRRMQLAEVEPNAGHRALKLLEDQNEVFIITQNVDDLHERAGSTNIVHLHGELTKMRSTQDENSIIDIGYKDMPYGTVGENGHILRPHIVWFGEAVPMIEQAVDILLDADVLIIVGTSLEVYPAAGLMHYAPSDCPIYLIDPNRHENLNNSRIELIKDTAANVLPKLIKNWII